ncbi:hypothetical protein [Nostoc sp. NMS4]|uniref:hypothetical protein n=1 Tax=Nostoc sp. NMS4 TaxID=2815390 RepID=UPI0025EE7905|nr:hypothetical protein [Nostoc sp. NMS4]MBN3924009.1 hypothetical protein [Nostoc sp. NMS4]
MQNPNALLTLFSIALMFGGLVWRLASIKASLEQSIDNSSDALISKITILEIKLSIYETEYEAKKEFLDYRLHGHDELIQHKFDRCWAEIKEIQNFLSKNGFIPRDRNKSIE